MNYYIDFDNTLYETAKLTESMLNRIAEAISKNTEIRKDESLKYVKDNFNSTYGNIYKFAKDIADKYKIEKKSIIDEIEETIANGKNYVYIDCIDFLENLKKQGHKLYILTYISNGNQEYQMKKIIGSNLSKYFDGIIMTTEYKFNLDFNYKEGIFIDDDPRDLNGLFEKGPIKVIRIRKANNKRSKIDIENKLIEEYESFKEIKL